MLASFSVTAILITASFACGVLAQKARTVRPVYVAVVAQAGDDWELQREVFREFRKFRNVVIVKDRADITIQLAVEPLKGPCQGVIAAVLTKTKQSVDLQAIAGSDWQEVARYLADRTREDIERMR